MVKKEFVVIWDIYSLCRCGKGRRWGKKRIPGNSPSSPFFTCNICVTIFPLIVFQKNRTSRLTDEFKPFYAKLLWLSTGRLQNGRTLRFHCNVTSGISVPFLFRSRKRNHIGITSYLLYFNVVFQWRSVNGYSLESVANFSVERISPVQFKCLPRCKLAL